LAGKRDILWERQVRHAKENLREIKNLIPYKLTGNVPSILRPLKSKKANENIKKEKIK